MDPKPQRQLLFYVLFENAITLAAFVCLVIIAEGAWKWMSLLTLLNLTTAKFKP